MKAIRDCVEIATGLAAVLLVVLCVVILTVHVWGWHSSDVAAWVQAVGSIGAIIGAFEVGRRQADASRRQAIEIESLAQARKAGAIVAVVNHAIEQAESSATSFRIMPTYVLSEVLQQPIYTLAEAVGALLDIPLYEAGTSQAVMHFAQIQVALKEMLATIDRFKAVNSEIAQMEQVVSANRLDFTLQIARRSAIEFIKIVENGT